MYNRYIPEGTAYTRIPYEEGGADTRNGKGRRKPTQAQGKAPHLDLSALLGFNGKKEHAGGLSGMLNALKLDDLDVGDILLILILLFLFLEEDNTEIVITLGLMLLMGLGGKEDQCTTE